jgi:hypothetical protein
MPQKIVVLVVGADYPRYEKVGGKGVSTIWEIPGWDKKLALWAGPWRRMALDYAGHVMNRERRRPRANRAIFAVFDCFKGTLETFGAVKHGKPVVDESLKKLQLHQDPPKLQNYRRLVGKSTEAGTVLLPLTKRVTAPNARVLYFPGLDTDGPATVGDYVAKEKAHEQAKQPMDFTLGMYDVYLALGLLFPRNSVRELHVFSHGIRQGPILLNTPVFNPRPDFRSLLDKDGRPKDFALFDAALKEAKQSPLSAHFTSDAFCALWGCSADARLDELIRFAEDETKNDGPGTQQKFTIEFFPDDGITDEEAETQRAEFQRVWKGVDKAGNLQRELTRQEFADTVKQVLIPETYAKQLARASGRPVFAALPGTSSNYDGARRSTLALTHVPQKLVEDERRDLRDVLRFYANRLKITFELDQVAHLDDRPGAFSPAFGRGFGKYVP